MLLTEGGFFLPSTLIELKGLKRGQALLVCTKVDPHFCIMNINLAEEYSSEYVKMQRRETQTYRDAPMVLRCETGVLQPDDLADGLFRGLKTLRSSSLENCFDLSHLFIISSFAQKESA